MIEQITGYNGIRGSGETSETKFCSMFKFKDYILIDTPGFDGTENQMPFDCF